MENPTYPTADEQNLLNRAGDLLPKYGGFKLGALFQASILLSSKVSAERMTELAELVPDTPRIEPVENHVEIVGALPLCSVCTDGTYAEYIAKVEGEDAWKDLCETHFKALTKGEVGFGKGRYLAPSELVEAGGRLPVNVARDIEATELSWNRYGDGKGVDGRTI